MNEEQPSGTPGKRPDPCCADRHGGSRRASGLFWGLVLIWLGVSLFLQNQGFVPGRDWWKYFVAGLGFIFLVDAWARWGWSANALLRGRAIAGYILIGVGVAFLVGGNWWPLVLVIVGLVVLLNGLRR